MNATFTPSLNSQHAARGFSRLQHGLTLIEFMISITLGMLIFVALTLLIARQSATQGEFEKSSRQIENGRYAMGVLNDDIQMAGYYGEFSNVGATAPASVNPCLTDVAVMEALMVYPVQGYDSPATSPLSCILAANHKPNTDILVVRRVEPPLVPIPSAAASRVYVQSGLTPSGLDFLKVLNSGANPSAFTLFNKDKTTLASLRTFVVRIYFVSPCSVTPCSASADGGNPIPTLKVVELSSSGTMSAVTPLVEGIENLQIEYGVDSVSNDGSPDGAFVSTTADWANVMALRIHLVARNNERSPDYVDTKIYQLGAGGAAAIPATDHYGLDVRPYKRRVFSQMIRLVNPSGRRDK